MKKSFSIDLMRLEYFIYHFPCTIHTVQCDRAHALWYEKRLRFCLLLALQKEHTLITGSSHYLLFLAGTINKKELTTVCFIGFVSFDIIY